MGNRVENKMNQESITKSSEQMRAIAHASLTVLAEDALKNILKEIRQHANAGHFSYTCTLYHNEVLKHVYGTLRSDDYGYTVEEISSNTILISWN
jgi:hypothetical protein